MLNATQIDSYYGASQSLYGLALEARAGEITCVLGRNGVGKSTLLRGLAGHQPLTGELTWQGKNIIAMQAWQRARLGIAYVPQGREIFGQLTVLENLRSGFACLPRHQRILPDEIFDLFPVLGEMLHRRGGDLSGGQQQQLAIARALVTRPRLLMLDEPTEGIQPSIIKQIQKVLALLRERGDMAIILIEQYFDFAQALADRYVVLDRGRVVLSGERYEVDPEAVRRLLMV